MSLQIISTLILFLHWFIIVALSVRIVFRRPPVGVALAWLTVIFSVPFIGAGIYWLFGEKRLGKARRQAISTNFPAVQQWQASLQLNKASDPDNKNEENLLSIQAERLLGFPVLGENSLELLSDWNALVDRLLADIAAAHKSIYLCFYIVDNGGRTEAVLDALVAASARGLECKILADAVGSKKFLQSQRVEQLRAAGIMLIPLLPTGAIRTFVTRADLRNHRKIVVIDSALAYSGSQNLVDPHYFKQSAGVGEWVDAMIRIAGPAACTLEGIFKLDLSSETGIAFSAPLPCLKPGANAGSDQHQVSIQVVPSGPELEPEAIHQLLLSAIYSARHELVLTTP